MKKILILTILLVSAGAQSLWCAGPSKKSDLKILYVGGTSDFNVERGKQADPQQVRERMASFESFLRDYFTVVEVIHADDYLQSMSDDYDVTVMDGRPRQIIPRYQDQEKGIYLSAGYLTEDFDRPVVTIGEMGETIGRRIGSKNDWYCLCLDSDAHHWRAEHPVFNGPFEVTMTVENKPTPEPAFHYPYYYDGPIPEAIPMWKVQTKGFETDRDFRIGMVARPWGYEDSPEAEYISSGVSQKTLDAVAIGRHGNFLHWGFAASPRFMTEEAKPVLANAIVYISQFAGCKPIARKYNDRIATREYTKELRHLLTREYYEERIESDARWAEEMLEKSKQAQDKHDRGETLSEDEKYYLGYEAPTTQRTFEEHLQRYGKDFYNMFGTDIPAYGRFFDENHDYFYGEGFYHLEVDEDVKSLGIPNYDKRILDAAIRLLETGEDSAKGRRILERYTLREFSSPAQWRQWYESQKDNLFWTESGGWLFLENGYGPGMNDYRIQENRRLKAGIPEGETNDSKPVAVSAGISMLHNGNRELTVKIKIHPGYHIYDRIGPSEGFIATDIELVLPEGYAETGVWNRPYGKNYGTSGTTVWEDTVILSRELSGSGEGLVEVNVTFQCCDAHICFPPQTTSIQLKL